MNSIAIYIRANDTAQWEEIYRGNAVSAGSTIPATYAEMLDESLDSGYIDFRGANVGVIRPLTQVRLDIEEQPAGNTYSRYYVVGGDEAVESPNGSGKWTHKLFMLEPTKLTEGVLCQSITFTNTKGNVYASDLWVVS